jgi:hypothetical protein
VEATYLDEASWAAKKLMDLPTLTCKVRAKRVSSALKEELSNKARQSPDIKCMKTMLAGKRVWGKCADAFLVPGTAKHWDWDTAYQNLCSARRAFSSQPKSIAVTGDDGNVTEKTSFLCVRSQSAKVVMWCPIQAGCKNLEHWCAVGRIGNYRNDTRSEVTTNRLEPYGSCVTFFCIVP